MPSLNSERGNAASSNSRNFVMGLPARFGALKLHLQLQSNLSRVNSSYATPLISLAQPAL